MTMPPARFQVTPQIIKAFTFYRENIDNPTGLDELLNYLNTGEPYDHIVTRLESENLFFKKAVWGDPLIHSTDKRFVDAKLMLPEIYSTYMFSSYQHQETVVSGVVDMVGFGTGYMFHSVEYGYNPPVCFNNENQWLFRGLFEKGVTRFMYLIRTKEDVTEETYFKANLDFSRLEENLEDLARFLEENKENITNKFIFIK